MTLEAKIELDEFFKFSGFKKNDKVWDFGCGTGRFIKPLQRIGCKVIATDICFGMPPKQKVDKFLLACVLHYNRHKAMILYKAYWALNKSGRIVIIEPNPYNPFFYCLYFWRWITRSNCPRRWNKERHMMSCAKLVKLLDAMGFKNIRTKKYAWFPSKFKWLKLNEILNKTPFINWFNAFNWIVADK
jgi:ubiquinone/menaquinone biosynthesis C-methylase UbiE